MNTTAITISLANHTDINYLVTIDDLPYEKLQKKITHAEILIIKQDDIPIWCLRFSYFWEKIPFMDHLVIGEKYRGKWRWTIAVNRREQMMSDAWYSYVMTSTEAWLTAQHFYRKLWYVDIGSLLFSRLMQWEPNQELFLMKNLYITEQD